MYPISVCISICEGFGSTSATSVSKCNIEITSTDVEAVDKVELGEKINVRISVCALSKEAVENIAIVDLIPGGFAYSTTCSNGKTNR